MFFFIIGCGMGLFSCNSLIEHKTDDGISRVRFVRDSSYIDSTIRKMIIKNIKPFNNKTEYQSKTEFQVDSLLYSPDSLGIVILLISKHPISQLLIQNLDSDYFYNGIYLFSKRNNIDSVLKVYTWSPWALQHFGSYKEIQKRLYFECFKRRSEDNWDSINRKYNFNDKEFWGSDEFIAITNTHDYVINN